MPYALFLDDAAITKSFSTKAEVWDLAEKHGLVTVFQSNDEDTPRRALDFKYSIRLVADGESLIAASHSDALGRLYV